MSDVSESLGYTVVYEMAKQPTLPVARVEIAIDAILARGIDMQRAEDGSPVFLRSRVKGA